MAIFSKAINFLKEVKQELGKVAWSTRKELLDSTFLVIVVIFVMGLFIGGIDLFLSKLLSLTFR